jgi:hypothetical protein
MCVQVEERDTPHVRRGEGCWVYGKEVVSRKKCVREGGDIFEPVEGLVALVLRIGDVCERR